LECSADVPVAPLVLVSVPVPVPVVVEASFVTYDSKARIQIKESKRGQGKRQRT
jgi:hypothetical protein